MTMGHSVAVRGSGQTSWRERWPPVVIAIIVAGVVLRAIVLAFNWNRTPDSDASEYEILARHYSFAHPWSASFREPLWRALVKIATGPFGYGPHPDRIFTTAISIVALPVAWVLLRRLRDVRKLPERAAIIALAIVALSAQTNREASRGLREDLVMLIFFVFATLLLCRPRTLRGAALLAVPVGLLSVIRWEVSTFALGLTLLYCLIRKVTWAAPAFALLAIVLLSGPWLLANKHRHGQLLYNTEIHSTYYWKQEQPAAVRAKYHRPQGVDPPVHLTWSQYYFDYLGPTRALKRFVIGYPEVVAKLATSQVVPRGAAVAVLGNNQRTTGWKVSFVIVGLAMALAFVWIARRLRRVGKMPSLFWESLAIVLLAIAAYAVLADIALEMRVLMYTVPMLAICAGILADRLLRASDQAEA
jgi:hypothetical protein